MSILIWVASPSLFAQANHDRTVRVTASIQESPANITLNWLPPSSGSYTITHQKIWRRQENEAWGDEYDTLTTSDLTYIDTNVVTGVRYEYRILRLFSNGPNISIGYIESGVRIKEVDRRGTVILLVKENAATALPSELLQLQKDLAGDGWHVIREDITPAQTVTDVKTIIIGHYNNPTTPDVKSVFLFGRIPVPYSGNIAPDGHTSNHKGAWPADVFYAELDGTWTDTIINNTSAPARTQNIPGDGKYDQSILPSGTELEIGRVDFNGMNIFPDASTTEIDLLQRYLQKAHDYRHLLGNYTSIPRKGLIDDHWGYRGEDTFASNPWWNFTSFFGTSNIVSADWFTTLNTDTYLWAFGGGPGTYTSAGGVGSSATFGTTDSKAVFSMMLGSYFGDWDNANNFLRAPLAGTVNGLGLANMWTGRPHWHIHSMATGRTLGYGTRVSQNNVGNYATGFGAGQVHIALMGDPTLRLFPVQPVSGLTSTETAGSVELNWTASPDTDIQGYAIYRGTSGAETTGKFTRLNPSLVAVNSYTDLTGTPGVPYTYMVRAVKLDTSASASYLNSSQGVFLNATPAAVSGPEISIGGNNNPITSGATASLEANHTNFGGGKPSLFTQTRTFTITNDGTTDLMLTGGPVVTLSGAGAADFTVTSQPSPTTITAGNSATFSISFSPSSVGLITANVSLSSNDPDENTFTFTIEGTGIPNSPEINLATTSYTTALASGASGNETLTISNNGLGTLDYSISSKYIHRDSNQASGPSYQWTDISNIGTEITSWSGSSAPTDNGGSTSLPIGFSFPFFENSYTTLKVSTEGFLIFGNWVNAPSNAPSLPSLSAPANMIALYWDDLDLRSSLPAVDQGRVYYLQTDPDTFIIQFENVYQFNASPSPSDERLTCQAILKSSGEIKLYYKTVPTTIHYSVGIQNSSLDKGLHISGNTAYLSDEMAIRILPPAIQTGWLSPSSTSGTVAPSGSSNIPFTITPASLPFDNYFGCIAIQSNDPVTPVENVTINLTGGTEQPDIEISANGTVIPYNSTVAHEANKTDFGLSATTTPDLTNTYTITNNGSGDLTLGAITITGTDFTFTQPIAATLSAGSNTTFQISFPTNTPVGSYTATVTVPSNDSNETSYTFPIKAIKLGVLESWRFTHFGSPANSGLGANDSDPDFDGIDNLVEFALAGNPSAYDLPTILPSYSLDGSGRLIITFNRNSTLTEINYIVQASSDLTSWIDIASSAAGLATTNIGALSVSETGTAPVIVTVTDITAPPGKRFLRLKVVEN